MSLKEGSNDKTKTMQNTWPNICHGIKKRDDIDAGDGVLEYRTTSETAGVRNLESELINFLKLQGPLLLTWFNFNPSMDKQLHPS